MFDFDNNDNEGDSFCFGLLSSQDDDTNLFEFPPLADIPLESKDDALDVLKKRPHSPDVGASIKKPAKSPTSATAKDTRKVSTDLKAAAAAVKHCNASVRAAKASDDEKAFELKTDNVSAAKAKDPSPANDKKLDTTATTDAVGEPRKHSVDKLAAAGALTSFATRAVSASTASNAASDGVSDSEGSTQDASSFGSSRDPSNVINLVNNDISILSDYNNLLVRNIEFFYPSKSHLNYENLSGSKNTANMTDTRLGLRCIHCKDSSTHITAAAFFPSTIGSIASGLGTIGARHFGLGKCPNAHPDMVHQMVETKKSSSIQTRSKGRLGLDAYCKNIAQQYGIFDDEESGVCWMDTSQHPSIEHDKSSIASVLANMRHDTNIDMRPFVPSEMNCFWECNNCRSVDIPHRARGSVIFSVEEPTPDMIEDHLKICNGSKPLLVHRNAAIEPFYGDYEEKSLPPIRVKWESEKSKTKEGRSKRKIDGGSGIPEGIDSDPLCFDADKAYTTDFAFFIVSKLRRCFLTKTGGSRGACPVGYAGVACSYCAGDANERRFFYSTADQMRNSFSHIPSHLAACEKVPAEVKARLEELKSDRNRQKSLLKPGYHKIFIDRVWGRMHNGPSAAAATSSSVIPAKNAAITSDVSKHKKTNAKPSAVAMSSEPPVEVVLKATPSSLIQDGDRSLTSDLTFFTLLQVQPYKMLGSDSGDDSREIGFPGMLCSHCNKRSFFTTSPEHLSGLLTTISNHMQTCQSFPKASRTQLSRFKITNEKQLQAATSEKHDRCMQNVWSRLVQGCRQHNGVVSDADVNKGQTVRYRPVDNTKPLVTAEDKELVTGFTFFTMQNVRPCNLDKAQNGARSAFSSGFPGLECKHCGDTSNPRRFFYRTAEILTGNYAHIPSHIASCKHVPDEIKTELARLKESHITLKHSLDRGSQKKFFNNIWERLHQ